VDRGREDGGEDEVDEVSTVEGLDVVGSGELWLQGLLVVGVRARRLERCISKCCWTSSVVITSEQTEQVWAIWRL
jgi:hypothetical protein